MTVTRRVALPPGLAAELAALPRLPPRRVPPSLVGRGAAVRVRLVGRDVPRRGQRHPRVAPAPPTRAGFRASGLARPLAEQRILAERTGLEPGRGSPSLLGDSLAGRPKPPNQMDFLVVSRQTDPLLAPRRAVSIDGKTTHGGFRAASAQAPTHPPAPTDRAWTRRGCPCGSWPCCFSWPPSARGWPRPRSGAASRSAPDSRAPTPSGSGRPDASSSRSRRRKASARRSTTSRPIPTSSTTSAPCCRRTGSSGRRSRSSATTAPTTPTTRRISSSSSRAACAFG